jgi:hypothetical protein
VYKELLLLDRSFLYVQYSQRTLQRYVTHLNGIRIDSTRLWIDPRDQVVEGLHSAGRLISRDASSSESLNRFYPYPYLKL